MFRRKKRQDDAPDDTADVTADVPADLEDAVDDEADEEPAPAAPRPLVPPKGPWDVTDAPYDDL